MFRIAARSKHRGWYNFVRDASLVKTLAPCRAFFVFSVGQYVAREVGSPSVVPRFEPRSMASTERIRGRSAGAFFLFASLVAMRQIETRIEAILRRVRSLRSRALKIASLMW